MTSWRRLQDMSSRRYEDVFSLTIFRLPRHLEDVFKMSWKTKNCYAWKMSSGRLQDAFGRRLQGVLEDEKLLRWRRVEDVSKTCLENDFKTSSRPTNVCWVLSCIASSPGVYTLAKANSSIATFRASILVLFKLSVINFSFRFITLSFVKKPSFIFRYMSILFLVSAIAPIWCVLTYFKFKI